MNVSTADVLLAYRQAKNALPQEQHGLGSTRLAANDSTLDRLIGRVQRRATKGAWFHLLSIGDVRLAPKKSVRRKELHIVAAGSIDPGTTTRIDTRLNLTPSPSFATLEVLWLWAFGPALEGMLARSAKANRLYLTPDGRTVVHRSRWLFGYWREAYKRFRDDGLSVARNLLRSEPRECVVATLDLTSYYDNLDPSFLLAPRFVDQLEDSASARNTPFSRIDYIEATTSLLEAFSEYRRVASRLVRRNLTTGVPIGSLASKLISNVALQPLDAHIGARKFEYYARYVDDILVVCRSLRGAPSLRGLASEILPLKEEAAPDGGLEIDEQALGRSGSAFRLQKTKLKFYELSGDGGLDFLNVIQRDGRIIASERRAFLPPDGLGSRSPLAPLFVGRDEATPVHALRDADHLRIGRYAASTMLSRVETGIRLLEPEDAAKWASGQLRSVVNTLVDDSHWLDYLDMGLRTFAICVRAGETRLAAQVASAYYDRVARLEAAKRGVPLWFNGRRLAKRVQGELRRWLQDRLREEFCRSVPLHLGSHDATIKTYATKCGALSLVSNDDDVRRLTVDVLRLRRADLRADDRETDTRDYDLVSQASKWRQLYAELSTDAQLSARLSTISEFIETAQKTGDQTYARLSSLELLLMTQPPAMFDIAYLCARAGVAQSRVPEYTNAIRGTNYPLSTVAADDGVLRLAPPGADKSDPHVVLGNLPLQSTWFKGAAKGNPQVSPGRAQDLNVVVNAATALKKRSRRDVILLLPELSVPRKWLRFLAERLVNENVTLVAGLEYSLTGTAVSNETVGVFPSGYAFAAVCVWKKTHPAREEELLLNAMSVQFARYAGDRIVVDTVFGAMSVLICSELLDVLERGRLRGAIDLLLVPSWNKDTSTFDHTLETTANDLHCYIALANEANGSDCRVHTPKRKAHERVATRLICRDKAESISTDVHIEELRQFQRRSLADTQLKDKSFKPMPPGFKFRRP